jgi:hypothetical protein
MKLLNIDQNAKTKKGQKKGFMTAILYLAPANQSGINVCPNASEGCKTACLYTAGMGVFENVKKARIAKTQLLFSNKAFFIDSLKTEITSAIKKAEKKGLELVVRLNGTSDLPWENFGIMEAFPNTQFYDYSKSPFRMNKFLGGGMPKNYHLTFSLSETNLPLAMAVLKQGGNVAMVFGTKDVKQFPKTHMGFKVVNGDENDLRFKDPKNVIVALKMKGKAIYDETGFVQRCGNMEEAKLVGNA